MNKDLAKEIELRLLNSKFGVEAMAFASECIEDCRRGGADETKVNEVMCFVANRITWLLEFASEVESNRDYYCDFLKKCGILIGRESYVCDDGTVALEPLAEKIPQLVAELVERSKPINEIDRSFEVGVGDGGVGLASIRQMIELDKMVRN